MGQPSSLFLQQFGLVVEHQTKNLEGQRMVRASRWASPQIQKQEVERLESGQMEPVLLSSHQMKTTEVPRWMLEESKQEWKGRHQMRIQMESVMEDLSTMGPVQGR